MPQILYPSAVKAKRAFFLSGAAVMAVHNSSLIRCMQCGETNLVSDAPCGSCGSYIPKLERKVA